MNNTTYSIKASEIERKWYVIDAEGKVLGRLATEVAKLLKEGKNYQSISKETGASTATISRVNKCINYGSGGYGIVLTNEKTEN